MSQLFNPNRREFDPETFNYGTEADQLKRRQALAKQLMATQAPEGQMVSGWYVAPSHTATGLSVLQKALGGYMSKKNDRAQTQLDEDARKALAYQLSQGQRPQQSVPQVNSDPMIKGPDGDMIENVTTTAQAEPQMSPVAQQMDRIEAIRRTGPQGELVANQMYQQLFASPGKRYSMHSSDGNTFVLDEISGDTQQVGSAGNAPMKPDDQRKLIEQAYKGVKTIDQLAAANAQLQSAGVNAAFLTDDLAAARGMGGQADQIKAENETENQYHNSVQTLAEAKSVLNQYTSPEGLKALDEAAGGWNSLVAAAPTPTKEAETRLQVKKGLDKVINSYLTSLKMAGVGTSAFNSEKESERLERAVSAIDWTRMDGKSIQNELKTIMADIDDKMSMIESLRNKAVPQGQQVAPRSSARQSSVPGRGQTINAADLGITIQRGATGTF